MTVKSYRPAGVGMFPAQAGTHLLSAYFDGDRPEVVKSNIIGWQITPGRVLIPLVIDPRAADADPWIVSHPDGRVECSDGRCWDNIDLWLADECRPSPVPNEDHITAAPAPIRKVEAPVIKAPPPPMPTPISRSA